NDFQNNYTSNSTLAMDPKPFLPALEARFADAKQPLDSNQRNNFVNALLASDDGLRALVAWALATGDPEAALKLAKRTAPARYLTLSDEMLARLLATAPSAWGGPWHDVWDAVRGSQPRRPAAMRLLLANASASRTVRLAAAVLAADGTQAYRDALLKLLEL